jgi:hypothetical protein
VCSFTYGRNLKCKPGSSVSSVWLGSGRPGDREQQSTSTGSSQQYVIFSRSHYAKALLRNTIPACMCKEKKFHEINEQKFQYGIPVHIEHFVRNRFHVD